MNDENDEITFSPEEEEENPSLVIKKLRARLKESEEKAEEYLTGWQKERADLVNARKRDMEDREIFLKFAAERVIMDLIPALDSFDMALKFKETNPEEWEKLPSTWTKGVEYIYSQLLSGLENHEVKRIYPLGEEFDHNRDEALETVVVDDSTQNNKIVAVIQPGYSINGKVVRTAKVKVGKLKD